MLHQACVRTAQAADQRIDQNGLEMLLALIGRDLVGGQVDFEERGLAPCNDGRGTNWLRPRQEGHLAQHFARAEPGEQATVERYLDLAADQHAEGSALFALLHQRDAIVEMAPGGNAQHLPQFDTLELSEHRQ